MSILQSYHCLSALFFLFLVLVAFILSGRKVAERERHAAKEQRTGIELGIALRSVASVYVAPALTTAPHGAPKLT